MARARVLIAALVALTIGVTGCSGEAAPKVEGDFSVSITHVYGETVIKKKPERVVVLGWITDDVVAGLDLVPVGIPKQWGSDEQGYLPWMRERVKELGGELPANDIVKDDGALDYERILALKPDLVLAPHSGVTAEQYQRLSQIAPTVAYQKAAWMSGNWRELTTLVGKALGRDSLAEQRIAQVQQQMDEAKAKHPELSKTNFLYSWSLSDGETQLGFYATGDPRVEFLRELGLSDSPSLSKVALDAGAFYGNVSLEKLSDYDAGLLVAWSGDKESTARTINNPLVSRWGPVAKKNYYIIEDPTFAYATNGPSVVSIPWAIKGGFVDELAKAAQGGGVVHPMPAS